MQIESSKKKRDKENCKNWRKEEGKYVLDDSGDVQTSDAWCGKLARVYVGNFPHSSVHVFQVLSLHYQDRLGWVKVELWKEKAEVLSGQRTETVHDEMLKGTEPFIAALNQF